MAIFPNLILEETLQTNDKTRLNGTKSFTSGGEADVTLVRIDPGDGTGFVDVTPSPATKTVDYYLDWEYSTDGLITVQIEITTDGVPVISSSTINVVTANDDALFSGDQDLTAVEEEILRYVPKGRNSWLNVHRKAQSIILAELDERGIQNSDGTRITKDQILEIDDFNKWSTYLVLWLIMQDLSNSVDDKFDKKSIMYKQRMDFHRERSFLRIDFNKDGDIDLSEQQSVRSARMVRA